MTAPYIHVLVDPDPLEERGQLICDECKLEGTMEGWENFLNGEWVVDDPVVEGDYPVLLHIEGVYAVRSARKNKIVEDRVVWSDPRTRSQVRRRWSLPLPRVPKEE